MASWFKRRETLRQRALAYLDRVKKPRQRRKALPVFAPNSMPEAPLTVESTTRRHRTGRRPHSPESVPSDIEQLITLAREADPGHVQRWFNAVVARRIDEELEAMAVWLSSGWDPDVDTDRVRTLINSGQPARATNAIIAQVRKEVTAELRAHKRRESDDFLDSCIVE